MNSDQIQAELEVLEMQLYNRDNSHLISNPMEEILLISADSSFRASAKHFLSSQGYKVWQANDSSSESLSLLKLRTALRVIVLDLGGESDLALAAHLQQRHPGRYLIVALTSHPSIPAAEEALDSGIFYYLTKPAAGHSPSLAFAIACAFEESPNYRYSAKVNAEDKDRIFLSCASEDLDKVSVLHQRLANERFSPWLYSKDLYPGQQWRLKITETIKASSFFLFCLSSTTLAKTGFVHNEVKQALDVQSKLPESKIFLIPVRLENCPLPEALQHLACADLFAADGYRRLLDALRIESMACALNSSYR